MAQESPLYRRHDTKERGRHLVANRKIEKGQLILSERPLLCLQSLDNLQYATVCHCCKAFLGGPEFALQKRCSPFDTPNDTGDSSKTPKEDYQVISCRHKCGMLFCSSACEADAWHGFHQCLCTGLCQDESHPLVQFKQYAVQTNEILLLVAEWWVAQHLNSHDERYQDFVMEPWWEVVTQDPLQQERDDVLDSSSSSSLEESLRTICDKAADLLSQVWSTLPSEDIPPISALDIAKRIGACEQNAMGIRQRHPLCREILEDETLLERRTNEIVSLLDQAGFLGNEEHEAEGRDVDEEEEGQKVGDCGSGCASGCDCEHGDTEEAHEGNALEEEVESEMYSADEIATFLANLFIDEDGTVRDESLDAQQSDRQRDTVGDDLDYLFYPLDGTAMYATACKMNHSCDPNVIVLYKPNRGWGQKHPLTAFCVALKDIEIGEELTISYIETNEPYEKRQLALSNYGFQCICEKCKREASSGEPVNEIKENIQEDEFEDPFGDPFGDENDDECVGEPPEESENEDAENGISQLQKRLQRLDSSSNTSKFGAVPKVFQARVSAFLVQTVASLAPQQQTSSTMDSLHIHLLGQCSDASSNLDFAMCRIVGVELQELLFNILEQNGSWKTTWEREAYFCACLTCSVGLAHECRFLEAMLYLDKAMILGLPRKDDKLSGFIDYVEHFSAQQAAGPYSNRSFRDMAKCPRFDEVSGVLPFIPKERACTETSEINFPLDMFLTEHVQVSKPLVIRKFASAWPKISTWTDLSATLAVCSHRHIPVELGTMMGGGKGMKEQIITVRQFLDQYIVPSNARGAWALEDASKSKDQIAYLAQHEVFSQIKGLSKYLAMSPILCGKDGPSLMNCWIGSGGTRTPLHYDSYDNLLVQMSGCKYIRLYDQSETPKLYVTTASTGYGAQGNMSDVDCEQEDPSLHPEAKTAKYQEVILSEGDMLYIPSRYWHYVRSASTSVSVNYWF